MKLIDLRQICRNNPVNHKNIHTIYSKKMILLHHESGSITRI